MWRLGQVGAGYVPLTAATSEPPPLPPGSCAMRVSRTRAAFAAATIVISTAATLATTAVASAAAGGNAHATTTTRVVHGGQTTHLSRTGSSPEIAPAVGPGAEAARTPGPNRTLPPPPKPGGSGSGLSGTPASSSAIQNAGALTTFNGVNHYQQRFGLAGGNQWSLEPPDQALCVGG